MIYLTLPNFYENYLINNFFTTIIKGQPEKVREKCSIIQCSGQFSYCSWNGGINRNIGVGAYYQDFLKCHERNMTPLRFNCANVCLEDTDFFDTMGNLILELNYNGSNLIEISNLELMEALQQKWPNYKFVFSKQADLIHPFDAELLNGILDLDKFYLIGIPDRLSDDLDFLKSLNHRNKLEITINPICPKSCKSYNACAIEEHKRQLAYSSYSMFGNCNKTYPCLQNKRSKTLSDLKETYIPLGINHFTFSPYFNTQEVFYYYLEFFIKEEYQEEVLKQWSSLNNQAVVGGL